MSIFSINELKSRFKGLVSDLLGSISLGNYFEEFINSEVKSGRYATVGEVIRSALRLLEWEEKKERELIKALEIGEQSRFVENFDPKEHLKELRRQHL